MRFLFGFICVLALGAMGCSETSGTGGSAGDGGSGGGGGDGGSAGVGGTGGTDLCGTVTCKDDDNECAGDGVCDPADGECDYAPVEDGTACDERNACTAATCADGNCDFSPVQDGTACGDDAGSCQQGSCLMACTEQGIRDAIVAGGGPYTFDCDGPTTVVTEAEIVIDNNVILDGEGRLTVDGGGQHADPLDDHRVFSVAEGVTVELRGFTVTGGRVRSGDPKDLDPGGGIHNHYGTVTLTNSTVSGNTAHHGGGIYNHHGTMTLTNSIVSGNIGGYGVGGIMNSETMTLTNSTVSGNTGGFAGGIMNSETMTLTGSTVSGNTARDVGGINNGETMALTNSTVSGNTATDVGGIENFGTIALTSSTVSGNTATDVGGIVNDFGTMTLTMTLVNDDCRGGITSNGYNIESPGDTCGFDQVNVSGDDLKLGPLQDNGGPTETHALGEGSAAVGVIPGAECVDAEGEPLTTDQRGIERPQGSECDVGAVEMEMTP